MTYTMKCINTKCAQGEFIIEQSIKDPLPTICDKCGGKLVQVFNGARFSWNDKDICGKINKS